MGVLIEQYIFEMCIEGKIFLNQEEFGWFNKSFSFENEQQEIFE